MSAAWLAVQVANQLFWQSQELRREEEERRRRRKQLEAQQERTHREVTEPEVRYSRHPAPPKSPEVQQFIDAVRRNDLPQHLRIYK